MKNTIKLLSLLLLLVMLLQSSVVSIFAFTPIDVTIDILQAGTGYDESGDVKYKYSGDYVYNWGYRGETVTFLSPMAISFYSSSYSYDVLSEKSGGTSESTAKNSALYKALQSLMSSKHDYQTSYNATKNLFQYTDCQLGGGKISSFYSGVSIGPAWGEGNWNREHCWPNSKGDASGNGENDIMMLRPTSSSENSSRGNKAYGKSSGYYNPNSESNGKYDLRGDVARIVLYTYVRWNCTNTGSYNPNGITGTGGVIESISVLLEWIEADPVDTWELGRNDSVQSITGTRNVFVDYPEYAFLLFGYDIPEDMTTPSGEASGGGHNWDSGSITKAATCTTAGAKTYTCTDSGCGKTKTETIPALGHSYNNGSITTEATCETAGVKMFTCSKCNATRTETISALGHSYGDWIIDVEATDTTTGSKHRICSICENTETRNIPVLGHEHVYTSVITKPTCTQKGYTTYTCECGETYVDSHTQTSAHSFTNGVCVNCGALESDAPKYSKEDFSSILTSLVSGRYKGEERFEKICEALKIYDSLSSADKESLSSKYNIFKTIVTEYNQEATVLNNTSSSFYNISVTLDASMIAFATYTVLKKKEF